MISGYVLKTCCNELSFICAFLFNLSLSLQQIPLQWKNAEIIPVPKKKTYATMNDLRPIALTPIVMKCFERLVLNMLQKEVSLKLDPLQFAYKAKRSVDDAVIVFMNNALKHLDKSGTFVRVLFIDFSSAFNTIQPHLMAEKLLSLNVNKNLIGWILDFLTTRTQHVKLNSTVSNTIGLNTGAPQGCVLSPTLYTLYTNDFLTHDNQTVLLKFADDSAFQGLMSSSVESYFNEIQRFVEWCERNYLLLNVSKTKELIIDFRQDIPPHPPVLINNECVELVQSYKYLGFIIDDKLNWHEHISTLSKKLNQRLYFLRKLRSFDLDSRILKLFYSAVIESLIAFGISCWGKSITDGDKGIIDKIIHKAEKIVNDDLRSVDDIYSKACLDKLRGIVRDDSHPLHNAFVRSEKSKRFIQPAASTTRYQNAFVPASVRTLRALRNGYMI